MSATPSADSGFLARIERLNAAYIHAIDDDRLEDWPGFFTADATYRILTRENWEAGLPLGIMYCEGAGMMRDRISAMRTANIFEPHTYCHMIGPSALTDGQGEAHRARSNFTVIRTMHSGEMSVFACGRYLDRIVEQDGALKLAERTVICDSRQVDTLLVVPL